MGKVTIDPLMTNRSKYDLTEKSQDVKGKVQEILKRQFAELDGNVLCKVNNGKVEGEFKLSPKGSVKGSVWVEVTLKVGGEKEVASSVSAEFEGKNDKEVKEFKSTHLPLVLKTKGAVDRYLKEVNEIDLPPEPTGPPPEDLTDATWKKYKNATLLDTGMGKAMRAWEASRKLCDERSTLCLKAFETAKDDLNMLALVIGKTRDAASKTLHRSALTAINAYPALVKTAREKLEADKKVYQDFITKWKTACEGSVETHKHLDLEIRGLISVGVASALSACNQTKNSTKDSDREESVRAVDLVLKELARVQKMADQKFNDTVSLFRKDLGPHPDDRPKEALEALQNVKKLQENLTKLHNGVIDKLEKAKKENQPKKK